MRPFRVAAIFTVSILLLLGVAFREALAVCIPQIYNVTSSAPPPIGFWTDTSGAVWNPPGGFPGCAPGDTAADPNPTPTTLIINSAIPNPITGLILSCPGCAIDIQSGGSLTLAGSASLSSSSTIIVEPGGQLTIANGGTLTFNPGTSLSVNGGLVDVQTGGALVQNGASTVTNGGTLRLSGGTWTVGALFTVQSTGTIELDGGTVNGGSTVNNNGTILQNSGTTSFSPVLNNSSGAHLNINGGTLSLGGGGTGGAPVVITAGATLDFPSSTYTLTTNGTVSGAGALQVSGGTLSIGGVTSPSNFTMTGGTLTGAGFMTVTGTFAWSGGTLTGNGGTQIAGTGSGNFSGANGSMILDGRLFDDYGSVDYNATTNPLNLINGGALAVYGTFNFSNDGNITGDTLSSLTISPNGVLFKNGGSGTSKISPKTYNNATVWVFSGTLEFAGDGTHNGSFEAFDNTTLVFSATSTTLGVNSSISSSPLGTVAFRGGSVAGSGNFQVDGLTTLTGSPSVSLANGGYTHDLTMDSGFLTLANPFDLKHSGTWSGGKITLNTPGTFLVDAGATLTNDGAAGPTFLSTGELRNNGTFVYKPAANPLELDNNADIDNEGLFDLQTDTAIKNGVVIIGFARREAQGAGSAPARRGTRRPVHNWASGPFIYNGGTMQKSAGSGTQDIQPALENDATVLALSGAMQFDNGYMQSAGKTTLGPGGIKMNGAPMTLTGGTLDGSGTVTGDVANTSGTVAPGGNGTIGTINVTGNYTQGAAAFLDFDISAVGTNDVLAAGNAVTLDGQLAVTLLGGFQPANGNVFIPMTFASRTGDFAATSFPTWASGHGSFSKSYTPTELDLSATVTPPSADLAASTSGPAGVNTGAPLSYTVTITNNGPDSSSGTISVADTLPAGVTGASGAGTGWSCGAPSGGVITCTTTAVVAQSGTFPTLTFSMTAPSSDGSVSDSATVSSSFDSVPGNNTSSASTNVLVAQADLSITKSGPPSVNAGQNIVYTIVVTNNGPQPATGVVVNDSTPSGLTFVSNSGGCTTAFPCALGSLTAGQIVTITSTFSIPPAYANPSITNTASVSGTTSDPSLANNSAMATTTVTGVTAADVSVFKHAPGAGNPGGTVDFAIDVFNNGPSAASNVLVTDPTPAGLQFVSNTGACTTPFPCTISSIAPGALQVVIARYKVTAGVGTPITNTVTVSSATSDPNPANNTSQASFTVSAPPPCPAGKPVLATPAEGAASASPASLSWSGVANALTYTVNITGATSATFTTDQLSALQVLPNGSYTWTVAANFASPCASQTSAGGHFSVCSVPDAPVASVVGESTTGQTYAVSWTPSGDSGSYELQEAGDFNFTNPASLMVSGTSRSFTKTATAATPFFYRVRAIACGSTPFSHPIGVVVVPIPGPHDPRFNVTVPAGSTTPVVFQVFIPGLPGGPAAFLATADKPWIGVLPQAGIVPQDGTTLTISLDPSDLVNGTWTGTILVVYTTPGSGKIESDGSTTSSIPVSISLVTPVTPGRQPAPTANTLIIPTVGHLFGVDSQWQSDIRVANLTTARANYLVTFTSGDPNTPVKQTTLAIDAGATTALDDIVRNWFGVGSLSDSANGLLYIQATDSTGHILSARAANDVSVNKITAVSSRTYNTQASASSPGTLGQFVPATAFASFIGRAGGAAAASLQSIQQIAQNDAYRTNVGLVEASGKSAAVALSVFDGGGSKLLSLPVTLNGGEQRQLNALLAQNNISLTNGRVQVEVTGGDGRVQAYASVIDARSGDPFLISGSSIGAAASNFVVPAVGDLNLGTASWRSDVRIFNAGLSPQTASLTYFPNGDPSHSTSQTVSPNPGTMTSMDSVVPSLFGLSNPCAALPVPTPPNTQLVFTPRTFDQTANGTLGQFLPAVTNTDAVGRNDRSLQILQAEESVRYRTNVGIAEVTGKPATVEIAVFLPDSKVVPHVTLQLGANESRQLDVLGGLGIGAAYNARLAIRVTDGDGRVTAYGSVVDMTTQAPTYIPAQ